MTTGSVERIARYRIVRRIGRGGMGVVYRAVDERDGREVALKVIRDAEAAGAESAPHINEIRERFDREAEILKSLLHVNIVSFYEIGEEDGTPYLAMEFLDGVPLTHYAGKPYTETLPLLVQASHGMAYLASRGIVHRDLSPDNIFVIERAGGKIVKLLDFGIAKLFERPTGLESLTATGFFLGKVAYGSPEQLGALGHGAPLDWRSDVYSLGVIFYQILAGRRPFEGKAPVEYIAAHLNVPAPPVAAPPGTPPLPMELVRLISQMLEKRREERPKTYREIIDRLVSVLREAKPSAVPVLGEIPPDPPETPTGPTELVGRTPSQLTTLPASTLAQRRRVAGLAAGVIGLAALLVLFIVTRLSPQKEPAAAPSRRPRPGLPAGTPTPAPSAATAGLQILATPFARVVSITEVSTGRPVALEAGATTPLLLSPLPPGDYRVVLSCPALKGKSVTRTVAVSPTGRTLLNEPFLSPEALLETLR